MSSTNATAPAVASPAPVPDGKYQPEKTTAPAGVLRLVREIEETNLLDARGYRRAKATLPGYHAGRTPKSKGRKYPPDPPTIEELVRIVDTIPETPHGRRLRALIIVLWRAGLRISEALALLPSDLDAREGSVLVRHGKGDKRRTVAMDDWAWSRLQPWLDERRDYPKGPVFCVLTGPTAGGREWNHTCVRRRLHQAAHEAGVEKRIAPHQLRHMLAVELWRSGVDLLAIQRQLGHARLDVTQLYLESVAPMEALKAIRERPAPVMPVSA